MLTPLTSDHCIKCNICASACPVAAVTDLFPGPKTVGPQAQRFREPGAAAVDNAVEYCSGCGVCSRVCPHGVQIAEMNIIAKAALAQRDGIPLRNRLLGRSELLGQVGAAFAPLSNLPIQIPVFRAIGEATLGISRHATFPAFKRESLRSWFEKAKSGKHKAETTNARASKVVYFHGCSTNYYEPHVGQTAIAVLRHNGCEVALPEQKCCGLPLQSNGEFDAARANARANIASLAPYVKQGYVIVGTSTSCALALKHEYHSILGIAGDEAELVAHHTLDFFEFLEQLDATGNLRTDFLPLRETVIYHAPCQLKSHNVGRPAAALLRRIPGVIVEETDAECCGVAGTYGLKAEKYAIAKAVGQAVFDEIQASSARRIICDSETCRWWLEKHTGKIAVHPMQILAEAYGL
jgi:glycerol-3-phosphate dehydrogenase subunit C